MLEQQYGFTNLYNLKGGIMAWAEEIDTEMAKY
jgi:adenylyltransferase/sulfurtransferase